MKVPQRKLARLRKISGSRGSSLAGFQKADCLLQTRGNSWGRLTFKDMVKFG